MLSTRFLVLLGFLFSISFSSLSHSSLTNHPQGGEVEKGRQKDLLLPDKKMWREDEVGREWREEEVDGEWREEVNGEWREEESDTEWRDSTKVGRWREEELDAGWRKERNEERMRREGRSPADGKNLVEDDHDEGDGRQVKEREKKKKNDKSQEKPNRIADIFPKEKSDTSERENDASITCTETEKDEDCPTDGFRCKNGSSIHMKLRCDTINDCMEGEDEEDCETHTCQPENIMSKCDDGKCVLSKYTCDGENDCDDNSDEKNCSYRECWLGIEFTCDNGKCVRPINICNGENDCGDGSDERDCGEADFKYCKSGKKIHRHYWCDGLLHCWPTDDDIDEADCPNHCENGSFTCKSGRCVSKGLKCDGYCDCPDCEDEHALDCNKTYRSYSGVAKCIQNTSAACSVPHNHLESFSCIRKEHVCDGIEHCRSAEGESEESGCNEKECNGFPCADGHCITKDRMCDGVMNCLHGDDEANCIQEECKEGQWQCEGGVQCINSTKKCDSKYDCLDRSDEMDCEKHKCSADQVKCESGQCIKREYWCNHIKDCIDGSDEDEINCMESYAKECEQEEVFQCADGKQCIPLEYHCMIVSGSGCVDESHLVNCSDKICPNGIYKCKSGPCLPAGKCTDTAKCPESWDDADGCPFQCSKEVVNCTCLDITANCSSLQLYMVPNVNSKIKKIDLSCNNLGPFLADNIINSSGTTEVTFLNLSSNSIHKFKTSVFHRVVYLKILDLSNNNLTSIRTHDFDGLRYLSKLDLRGNQIQTLEADAFSSLHSITELDLSHQQISSIDIDAFSGLTSLITLDLTDNPIEKPDDRVFSKTRRLKYVKTDRMSVCCVAMGHNHSCVPPVDNFSSCEDLMKNSLLRISIWVMGFVAILGNMIVILCHSMTSIGSPIFAFLVMNLGIGDLLMGVYLMILAGADLHYRGDYARHAYHWKQSSVCQLAGFLSTLSSELSVFTLTVITLERLKIAWAPLSTATRDLAKTKRNYCLLMMGIWTAAVFLAALPLSNISYFRGFYSRSGVCLALHITQDNPNGWEYSVFVFMVLNFLSFTVIAVSQAWIYKVVNSPDDKISQCITSQCSASRRSYGQRRVNKRTGRILTLIVVTDAACWLPIIFLGVLSLCDVPLPPEIFTWVAVFILPVNSALNPVIYTFIDRKLHQQLPADSHQPSVSRRALKQLTLESPSTRMSFVSTPLIKGLR